MHWIYDASPEADRLSEWPKIVGVYTAFTALMVAVVCLRLWVRHVKLWADDWITVLSMVCIFMVPTIRDMNFMLMDEKDIQLRLQFLGDIPYVSCLRITFLETPKER